MFVDYQCKGEYEGWRVSWDNENLDKAAIDALVAEVLAYTPA